MNARPDVDAALARALMREESTAALATLEAGGGPFASHVLAAAAEDGAPLLLLSRLAVHSRNLQRDARASLLFVRAPAAGSGALTAARLTLTGRLLPDADPSARQIYLARHPDAAGYAGFGDFRMFRMQVEAGHLVAGFGRIAAIPAAELLGPEDR